MNGFNYDAAPMNLVIMAANIQTDITIMQLI